MANTSFLTNISIVKHIIFQRPAHPSHWPTHHSRLQRTSFFNTNTSSVGGQHTIFQCQHAIIRWPTHHSSMANTSLLNEQHIVLQRPIHHPSMANTSLINCPHTPFLGGQHTILQSPTQNAPRKLPERSLSGPRSLSLSHARSLPLSLPLFACVSVHLVFFPPVPTSLSLSLSRFRTVVQTNPLHNRTGNSILS